MPSALHLKYILCSVKNMPGHLKKNKAVSILSEQQLTSVQKYSLCCFLTFQKPCNSDHLIPGIPAF